MREGRKREREFPDPSPLLITAAITRRGGSTGGGERGGEEVSRRVIGASPLAEHSQGDSQPDPQRCQRHEDSREL